MKQRDIALKKIPPNSIDCEKSVLGAIILNNEYLLKVLGIIDSGDFYYTNHKKIFETMKSMEIRGKAIDLLCLSEELLSFGHLEIIGGPPYLMDLLEATPTATMAVHHSKIIKEKSKLRKLIAISTQLNLDAYGEQVESSELLTRTEELLMDIQGDSSKNKHEWAMLNKTLPDVFQDIEHIYESKEIDSENSIATGFDDLDEVVRLNNSELIIVAGRPSMGKTAFCFNVAVYAAKRDIPVAIFSIETSKKKASERILCTEANVSSHAIHHKWMKDNDWPKLTKAIGILNNLPLYLCDSPYLSLHEFRLKTKTIIKEQNIKLIIIDYIQKMHIKGSRDRRTEEISAIARGVKSVAREFNIPIIAISQLSRKVEERKPPRPILSDLKESGELEQEADIVKFLYRPAYYNKNNDIDKTTDIIIAKNRNGPTGTVKLLFEDKYTKFKNISFEDNLL
jgi:replicative DNA helicase